MFTFKTERTTGLSAVADSGRVVIKIKRKEVGYFDIRNPRIRLAVVEKKDKAGFRWITLKYEPTSIEDAKEFLKKNYDAILKRYDVYRFEEDL